MKKLFPYQERMVAYIKDNKNAAVWCEMRLGKTLCTIRALKDIPGTNILVVCPKSVIPTWQMELSEEKVTGWNIVNYEKLKKWDWPIEILIIDESVRMKNPRAQITKVIQNYRTTYRKILLSGNPAPNTPLEYFTQMAFINGGEWMGCKNWWQFRNRYFTSDYMGFQWWPKPKTKEKIKEAVAQSAFVLSRKQVGMKSRKVYEQRIIEMPKKVQNIYKKLEKEFVLSIPYKTITIEDLGNSPTFSGKITNVKTKELELDNVLVQLNYLQQISNGFISSQEISDFKVKELVDLLEGELKGEPVIIWTNFRSEQTMIIDKLGLSQTGIINGDTSLEKRKFLVEDFNKKVFNYLVISVGCGKFGLDLSRSSTAIYFSNSYSLDDRSQSEERIFNVKKDELLLIIDLITKDSVQEDILKILKSKQKQSRYFLGEIVESIRDRM